MTISYYEKIGGKVENISDEIPFELPEGWAWCRGYSCFEGMESTKPQGDFFDYIDIDAIDNRLHCIKEAKHLPVSDAPSRASRAVKDGSVLFSLVRPYLENIALVEEKHSNCIASTGFYVCNSNGVLLPEFMFFLMISGYVVNGLNQYMKGDNSPSISKDNICSFIEKFPAAAQDKSYIGRCSLACAFLYPLGTKEYNICQEINAIKKCAISAESLEAKKTLEKEWMNEADKLFEFCAIEMRNNLELQNSVHLLYSPDIEKCVKKLLSIYESFQLGHVYFTNAEFDSAIQKIIQVSNEIQISYLLESIEQETLKRK